MSARILLVGLCCVLVLIPPSALGEAQLGLGLGYVRGECSIAAETGDGSRRCFEGARAAANFNFLFLNRDGAPENEGSDGGDVESSGGSSRFSGFNMNGVSFSGRGGEAVLAVLLVILVVYGIYVMVAAIASNRFSLGLFAAEDFQADRWGHWSGENVTTYRAQRAGLQANFYLFRSVDLGLSVGVGPVAAQIRARTPEGNERYNLRGIASKASFGYVPSAGSGPIVAYEFEGTFFNDRSIGRYLEGTARSPNLPRVRHSGAGMIGWMMGF